MGLRIKLLGGLRIEYETGEVSEVMKSNKGCALLAYLLVTNAPQPREVLADLLWDAGSTAQSLQSLRTLLSRLRQALPELEVSRTQVRFPPETAVFLDYLELTAGLHSNDPNQMAAVLPLYRGDLLAGFYVENAPIFNEWLLLTREKLRQQVTGAFRQLCLLYQEQSDWVKGVALAQRWLALDELDEEALRHLLQLLAASGQIDVALRQYEVSRQRLWGELGVEPMGETRQLVAQIEAFRATHGGGVAWDSVIGTPTKPPNPDELPEPGNLPSQAYVPYQRNPDFLGRQATLLQIGQALLPINAAAGKRAVAITGMGGLGKTQLTVEFCYRYGRYFPGGVFWLSFANEQNIAEEVVLIGGERGLGLYQDAERLTQHDKVARVLKAWQEPIPRLLIFDNCEDEALLTQWLPVTGGCRVLITSRRGVWSPELGVMVLPLHQLERLHSVQILQKLVVGLEATTANNIAQEIGDLPLALYLAGSFLRRYHQISPAHYLHQLRQLGLLGHPSLQGRGTTHSPTGHALSIGRTFALNFEQLDADDETDAMALRLLACVIAFAHGEAIPNQLLLACVQTTPDDLMQELLAMDGLTRLLMLGILREVGSDDVQIHRLLARYAEANLSGPDIEEARTAVEEKILEITIDISVETWGLAVEQIPSTHLHYIKEQALSRETINAARLVNLWGNYLRDIGNYEAAEQQLLTAQKLKEQILGKDHPETAESLFWLGKLYIRMGKYELSQANYEQYLAFWQQMQTPDMMKIARVLHALGTLHVGLGNFALARSYLNQALDLYVKQLGSNHTQTGFTLISLGILYYNTGDFETGRLTFEQALPIMTASFGEMSPDTANVYGNLGKIYLRLGDLEKAWDYSMKTLNIREHVLGVNHLETAFSLNNLGQIRLQQTKYEEALAYLERALLIREQALKGDHPHLADSYHQMGKLLLQTDRAEKAITYLQKALVMRERVLDINHPEIATLLIDLGEWYAEQGDSDLARSHYVRALAILDGQVAATHPDLKRVQLYLGRY